MYFRCVVVILVSLLSVDAVAQERFVVRGLGFGTFGGDARSTQVFGAGVGVNVNDVVQITLEAAQEWGRADPRNDFHVFDSEPAPANPLAVTIVLFGIESTRQDRRLTGGVRFRAPVRYRVGPFAVVNMGLARVTDRYLPNEFGGEGDTRVDFLVEVGGGLSLTLTDRVKLESSYRIGRVGRDSPMAIHALGGGLAVGF